MTVNGTLRILVVDDDRDAADSLAELFDMEGHQVVTAYDGNAAIQAYRNGDFDLAFMDIMMPGKNGVESFFEIRRLRPDAKVYMMTGYSVEQLVQQAIDNGALGVLSKPLDIDKVSAAIEESRPHGVLLVSDLDPGFAAYLKHLVSGVGYRCDIAASDDEARTLALSGDIDVLILDMKQPVIDSIEVFTNLKNSSNALPTIIITGQEEPDQSTLQAIRQVSVTGILNKPFDPGKLLDRLQELAA